MPLADHAQVPGAAVGNPGARDPTRPHLFGECHRHSDSSAYRVGHRRLTGTSGHRVASRAASTSATRSATFRNWSVTWSGAESRSSRRDGAVVASGGLVAPRARAARRARVRHATPRRPADYGPMI